MKPGPRIHDPLAEAEFETICSQYGDDYAARFGAAAPAIYQTSTFIYPSAEAFETRKSEDCPHYDYTRGGNPTASILEGKLARLERGNWCESFGSGMGAIAAAINIAIHSGAHVVCAGHAYGPARWYLQHMQRFGVETTFVRGVDMDTFRAALRPNTKLVYLESPTSGWFEVLDIAALADIARRHGAMSICDNSWASPYYQNPLELGADLVVHSATKFIGGHSDVVAGVLMGRDEQIHQRVFREIELGGATLDPFGAWLLLRGLRTLPVRMRQHRESALRIATFLESHAAVARVHHPGLPSHSQHALAMRQMRGTGSLFSFEPRVQTREATYAIVNALKLFSIGVSWGGYESLVLGGSFFSDPGEPRWLIRLHIGLESTNDLIADLQQALGSRHA
ncbi:MAG: aminotransferase class I/II-fold pyridoxal phosphate-dependent enzyme [Phycisphaerales bacterium]|nr:aminotransferase class I/II-fold pyridoxal phosphate-dependent enzyme [Phycisphaerales bacterium]